MKVALVWFRRDLRIADNAALAHALDAAERVVPVYVHMPNGFHAWSPGAASRWWLHHSLAALDAALAKRGSRLVIRRAGSELAGLRALIKETGTTLVCWNRLYEPAEVARDAAIADALRLSGVEVATFPGHLLFEPEQLRTGAGAPYRVYTPFARAARQRLAIGRPLPGPRALPAVPETVHADPLASLELLPRIRWDAGIARAWDPGEDGAHMRLRLLRGKLADYAAQRDLPGAAGTSRLSPHLHFGEITPAQAWRFVSQQAAGESAPGLQRSAETFERELLWREFAQHVLHHFPNTPDAPLDARFQDFAWQRSAALLTAWQRGETGFPIIDAGMRELWQTGFMHNRVRMITASFLTKHARLDWRDGARWFWDTLVDADLANNTLNWQWVAGCGADAAPYFRIFNPLLQSRKFDPEGAYLARWLPELKPLASRYRHAPWEAPAAALTDAGIELGKTYPRPVLDLAAERANALAAYRSLSARAG
jgi:deoxyribodipyrimidine photo-lyase